MGFGVSSHQYFVSTRTKYCVFPARQKNRGTNIGYAVALRFLKEYGLIEKAPRIHLKKVKTRKLRHAPETKEGKLRLEI